MTEKKKIIVPLVIPKKGKSWIKTIDVNAMRNIFKMMNMIV